MPEVCCLTADALGQVVVVGKEGLVVGTSLPYFRNGVADQYGSRTLQTPFGHCRRLLANAAQLVAGSRIRVVEIGRASCRERV